MNARVELPARTGAGTGASLSGAPGRSRNGRHPEELIRARDAAGRKILFVAGLALAVSAMALPIYAVEIGNTPLAMPRILPSLAGGLPVNRSLAAASQRSRELDPATTGSVRREAAEGEETPRLKPAAVANPSDPKTPSRDYVVKGVFRGIALIEGPDGLHEVAPGATLPGVGKIVSIERSGSRWVVVTTRTIIGEAQL